MGALLFSLGLGTVAVLQGGLNRIMAAKLPLGMTVLVNALIFLVAAVVYVLFVERQMASAMKSFRWEWWYLVPGLLGAVFVFGIPWAIPRIGALQVFVCIVAGQMITSLVWDKLAESRNPDLQGIAGALLAVLGAVVAAWKR